MNRPAETRLKHRQGKKTYAPSLPQPHTLESTLGLILPPGPRTDMVVVCAVKSMTHIHAHKYIIPTMQHKNNAYTYKQAYGIKTPYANPHTQGRIILYGSQPAHDMQRQ